MIVKATDLQRAHKLAASTGSRFIRWHTPDNATLVLRGMGPYFSGEAELPADEIGDPLNVAAPTALVNAWLNGINSDIAVEFDPAEKVMNLGTARSGIEVAVATHGEELSALDNLTLPRETLNVIGIGDELWGAIADVSWASALGLKSNNVPAYEAVHVSYGKVWATNRSQGAWIDMDLPEGHFPMIPAAISSLGSAVSMETAIVAIDGTNRLRVRDDWFDLAAPLVAGDPLPDHMSHAAILASRDHGATITCSSKEVTDALARLDRVDADELSSRAGMHGRVEMSSDGDGRLLLAVRVKDRKAVETIDAECDELRFIMPMGKLKAMLAFLATDELTIHHHGGAINKPLVIDAGRRHAMMMPVAGKL